jgi:hypothetical protein
LLTHVALPLFSLLKLARPPTGNNLEFKAMVKQENLFIKYHVAGH